MQHDGDDAPTIRRLVGVYNANGSVTGELTYFIGARLGRAHCALCDITHGLLRERADWKTLRAHLPVPFDTCHRDDQPDDVRAAHEDRVPVVLAVTDSGFVVLLGPAELSSCGGRIDQFSRALDGAVTRLGLHWSS